MNKKSASGRNARAGAALRGAPPAPPPLPPSGLPPQSLLPFWRRIGREFAVRGQRGGLPNNVAMTLVHLHVHPEDAEPSRLAAALFQPRQTMTFLLDQLERRNLAGRIPRPQDRRRRTVRLTAAGRKMAARLFKDLVKFEAAALATLPRSGVSVLHAWLNRYADALAFLNTRDDVR